MKSITHRHLQLVVILLTIQVAQPTLKKKPHTAVKEEEDFSIISRTLNTPHKNTPDFAVRSSYGPTKATNKVHSKCINSPRHLILSTISKYLTNTQTHSTRHHSRCYIAYNLEQLWEIKMSFHKAHCTTVISTYVMNSIYKCFMQHNQTLLSLTTSKSEIQK